MNSVISRILIGISALVTVAGARGQGMVLFDTHDLANGSDVRVFDQNGNPLSGPDLFLEVLAGPDVQHLAALTPLLPVNRTGIAAGYPDPFSHVYTTTLPAGNAVIGYRYFEGTSWDTATVKSALITTQAGSNPIPLIVQLTTPPTPPNEVVLGISVPEPTTWALMTVGLTAMLFVGRRTRRTSPPPSPTATRLPGVLASCREEAFSI
jgi:hypothetical protein